MKRSQPMRRTPMRRGRARMAPGPERDWTTEALAKVRAEGCCRVCDARAPQARLEAAHVIGRAKADETHPDGTGRLLVRAVDVVPLCSACHRAYDAHQLNLLPHLTPPEQVRAVQVAGGITSALQRTTGLRWAPVAPRTARPPTEAP